MVRRTTTVNRNENRTAERHSGKKRKNGSSNAAYKRGKKRTMKTTEEENVQPRCAQVAVRRSER